MVKIASGMERVITITNAVTIRVGSDLIRFLMCVPPKLILDQRWSEMNGRRDTSFSYTLTVCSFVFPSQEIDGSWQNELFKSK